MREPGPEGFPAGRKRGVNASAFRSYGCSTRRAYEARAPLRELF